MQKIRGPYLGFSEHPRWSQDGSAWSLSFWATWTSLHMLSWVATVVFNVRLLHAFAFSKKSLWLAQASVITLKTQQRAVNARWKRPPQRCFKLLLCSMCCTFKLWFYFYPNKKITRTISHEVLISFMSYFWFDHFTARALNILI